MIIREKADEVVTRDIPYSDWITGLVAIPIFSFAFYIYLNDAIKFPVSTFSLQSSWDSTFFSILWFLALIILVTGLIFFGIIMLLSPLTTTRIKRDVQAVDIIRRRLFFKNHQRFYFSQINGFDVTSEGDSEPTFYNILRLINGETHYLETTGYSTRYAGGISKKLNDALKKFKLPASRKRKGTSSPRKTKRKMKEPEK